MPAMLLADGTMGQMMEPVVLPEESVDPESIPATKPWATTGTGMKRKHNIVNSLYLKPDELEKTNIERFERYAQLEKEECRWEEYLMDDAEICVVSVGITARVSKNAIVAARKEGIKVGMIRPITLYPFPKEPLVKAATKVKSFLTVELNMGQMNEDVKLAINCSKKVSMCNRVGGMIPSADEVLEAIRKEAK
jgi:2-oxoglutarate ferredoxin oxidoreductase subunit alpha